MSRFRVIKSKGVFYVMTNTGAVAGGPFQYQDEADANVNMLDALEASMAAAANAPEAHKMNITKGYRSPDVEDGRGDTPPDHAAAAMMPPGWIKWNTPNGKPLPAGFAPDWKKHQIPVDPLALPNLGMDEFGDWVTKPGTVRDAMAEMAAAPPPPTPPMAPWMLRPIKPKKP